MIMRRFVIDTSRPPRILRKQGPQNYSRNLVLRNCSKEPDSEKSYDFIVIVLISAKILVFL